MVFFRKMTNKRLSWGKCKVRHDYLVVSESKKVLIKWHGEACGKASGAGFNKLPMAKSGTM